MFRLFFIKQSSGCDPKKVFFVQLTTFQKIRALVYLITVIYQNVKHEL